VAVTALAYSDASIWLQYILPNGPITASGRSWICHAWRSNGTLEHGMRCQEPIRSEDGALSSIMSIRLASGEYDKVRLRTFMVPHLEDLSHRAQLKFGPQEVEMSVGLMGDTKTWFEDVATLCQALGLAKGEATECGLQVLANIEAAVAALIDRPTPEASVHFRVSMQPLDPSPLLRSIVGVEIPHWARAVLRPLSGTESLGVMAGLSLTRPPLCV
jgi:hypothetical protein